MATGGNAQEVHHEAPNGHTATLASTGEIPPGLRPKPQPAGFAFLAGLPPAELIGLITDLIKTAIQQVPPRNGLQCATCALNRAVWWMQNQPALQQAHQVACEVNGIEPGSPQAAGLDLVAYLPPELQPGGEQGLPTVFDVTVFVQGTGYCPGHIPGSPQAQQGRLIAVPGISVHAAAQLAMAGAPGMPGVPG